MKRKITTKAIGTITAYAIAALLAGSIEECLAFIAPDHPPTPNFDKRSEALAAFQLPREREQAAADLQARRPDVRIDYDKITHAPVWVSTLGCLTGSTEEEILRVGDLGLMNDDPHRAVKAFLIENAVLFGHGPEVLTDATITREFVTAHNGMRTVVWQQQLDDVPVFEGELKGHIMKRGELVNISSRLLPDVETASGLDKPGRLRLVSAPTVAPAQALVNALTDLGVAITVDAVTSAGEIPATPERQQKFNAAPVFGEARTRLVWLPMNRSSVRLCWVVEFIRRSPMEGFRTLVDAVSGEVLVRQNRTCHYINASYRVYPSDSPSPFSPGHAQPSSGQPALVERQLLTLPALSQTASPLGWIRDYDNLTLGNNVDASANRDAEFPNPTPRPQGSPFRVFDFALDLNQDPSTYSDAAAVNLFYRCNWMHDKLYDLGFTEAAGNYQDDNFGRGGVPGDRILAYAQFGADTRFPWNYNNAAFFPAPDGTSGMIQMYVWDYPLPNRDGDLDAEIVLHEYTHGLSDRMVGITYAQNDRQDAGLSEGWSDFYALSLLSEAADNLNGNYAAGGYATYQLGGSYDQNYYYGIRRYPYSTDMLRNPLTFNDIDPLQFDNCASAAPFNDALFSSCTSVYAGEVHNVGEVWCVALWDARANLINRYGFATGNQLILQLVTSGMNLCPPNPDFIQARNAVLQADLSGQYRYDLWQAFGKRGMGWGAQTPTSDTVYGVVESFEMPPIVSMSAVQWTFPPYVSESYAPYLTFRISRTGSTASPLQVTFLLGGSEPGYAGPSDFTTLGCNRAPFPNGYYVVIPAGQSYKNVSIHMVDDSLVESTETVAPRIPYVPSYVVNPNARELPLYIWDNDTP